MGPWMMITLILLSVMIHEAQGRIRRLNMTPIISSASTILKNDEKVENRAQYPKSKGSSTRVKIAKEDENLFVSSSSINNVKDQRKPGPETYPDILDIAGMDYSQARRKPPIHN